MENQISKELTHLWRVCCTWACVPSSAGLSNQRMGMTVATFPWQWPFVKTQPIKFWQRHVTARIGNMQIGQQPRWFGCNGHKPTLMDSKTTSIAFGNELQNFLPLPNRARMLIIDDSQVFRMLQNEKPIGIGSTLACFNTFINEKICFGNLLFVCIAQTWKSLGHAFVRTGLGPGWRR